MTRFIKTTILGGILFLVPIVIFFAVIGKALELANLIAGPLAERLIIDSAGGLAVVQVLAVLILIAVCFIAGLAVRTSAAKNVVNTPGTNVLDKTPAYELLKAKTRSMLSLEEIQNLPPAITRFDDSWQLVLEIEHLADDKVVVPGPARSVL